MLDFFYFAYLLLMAGYLLVSLQKEFPFVVLLHGIFQYFFTQLVWIHTVDRRMSGLLLLFLVLTTFLLIWARSLNYSTELKSLRTFFRISQWGLLVLIFMVMWVKSPYVLEVSTYQLPGQTQVGSWSIQPFAKISGNILLFIFTFHLVLGWGSKWTSRQSVLDLGPFLIYSLSILLLHYFIKFPMGYMIS